MHKYRIFVVHVYLNKSLNCAGLSDVTDKRSKGFRLWVKDIAQKYQLTCTH